MKAKKFLWSRGLECTMLADQAYIAEAKGTFEWSPRQGTFIQ